MKNFRRKVRPHHVISGLAVAAIAVMALRLPHTPLFSDLGQFVLVGSDKIHLAQGIQVSSGDLATNGEVAVAENSLVNGNIFADKINIAENTQINGNASFNALRVASGSKILGATSTPISLPIVQLPSIPGFVVGTKDITVTSTTTLAPGGFDTIEARPSSTLILDPGTYNLNTLNLRDGSRLLFSASTTINIKGEFKVNQNVFIAQNTNISSTDLQINYAGTKPITAGGNSFLSLKLLAPSAKVQLGDNATLRGQVLAQDVNVGEGGILSRQDFFSKESDPTKVATVQGATFISNEIIVLFKDEATLSDALYVADSIGGRIIGSIPKPHTFKIEVPVTVPQDLLAKIQVIKNLNDPLIIDVVPNLIAR